MWDSNAPLQLLKTMPKKLNKENLEKIQMVIDADKYKNSLVSGFDLCGMYAPFCRGCKKTSIYPCAIAYINMLKANGVDVDIDAMPVATPAMPAVEKPRQAPATEPVISVQHVDKPEREEVPSDKPSVLSGQPSKEAAMETAAAVAKPEVETVEKAVEEPDKKSVAPEPDEIKEIAVAEEEKPLSEKRKIRIAVARKKIF